MGEVPVFLLMQAAPPHPRPPSHSLVLTQRGVLQAEQGDL